MQSGFDDLKFREALSSWHAPLELTGTAPRSVRPTNAFWVAVVIFSIILSAGIFVSASAYLKYRSLEEFKLTGAQVEAKIMSKTSHYYRSRHGGHTDYLFRYVYTVSSKEYANTALVSRDSYSKFENGDRVEAIYDPNQPQKSCLKFEIISGIFSGNNSGLMPMGVVFFVLGIFLFSAIYFPYRKQSELLKMGQVTGAQIIDIKIGNKGVRNGTYLFLDRENRPITGKCVLNRDLKDIGVNSIVTIIYNLQNSKKNNIYPAPLVRIVNSVIGAGPRRRTF